MRPNSSKQACISYLNSVAADNRSVLGAFDYYGQADSYNSADNYNAISAEFGVTPSLYNTFYTYDRTGRRVIYSDQNSAITAHARAGAICMVHASNKWAWDLGVSDSEKAEFITHLDKDGGKYYNDYHEWCIQLADAFTELKEAGVTVIYRPFVEMTNSSSDFWVQYCNTEAEYAAFKRVWRQTYDYMVGERGLNNVIWCLTPQFAGDMKEVYDHFYPGDDYVDIIGMTFYSYGTDSRTGSLEARIKNVKNADYFFSLGKPVGFSEIGVCYYNWDIGYTVSEEDKYGDFGNLIVKLKEAFAGKISFCSLWAGAAGPFNTQNRNPEQFIKDEFFIDLEEMLNSQD